MRFLSNSYDTPSESFAHKTIKNMIYNHISSESYNIVESSLEKYFKNRRADIYFKLHSGKEIVVEIQNSRISVKELLDRTVDYNKKNLYVLWILNGNGRSVESFKELKDKKNVKISPVENLLHKIYGGRVYYVNLIKHSKKITITKPFALHFSLPDNRKNGIYKKGFRYYYIRNANISKVPNWNLLCIDHKFKLARFYDKNCFTILRSKILTFTNEISSKSYKNCSKLLKRLRNCSFKTKCNYKPIKRKKLIKIIVRKFYSKYGKSMIFEVIRKLIQEDNFNFKVKKKKYKLN